MLQDLLRYTLSAQAESGVEIITVQQLIAIDARWSQYGIAPPFSASNICFDVMGSDLRHPPVVQR